MSLLGRLLGKVRKSLRTAVHRIFVRDDLRDDLRGLQDQISVLHYRIVRLQRQDDALVEQVRNLRIQLHALECDRRALRPFQMDPRP